MAKYLPFQFKGSNEQSRSYPAWSWSLRLARELIVNSSQAVRQSKIFIFRSLRPDDYLKVPTGFHPKIRESRTTNSGIP